MIVAAPVIAELNMPRFMAGGDTSRLTLDVTNLTDRPQTLNIQLTASGLVSLMGQNPSPVDLARRAYHVIYSGTGTGGIRRW